MIAKSTFDTESTAAAVDAALQALRACAVTQSAYRSTTEQRQLPDAERDILDHVQEAIYYLRQAEEACAVELGDEPI